MIKDKTDAKKLADLSDALALRLEAGEELFFWVDQKGRCHKLANAQSEPTEELQGIVGKTLPEFLGPLGDYLLGEQQATLQTGLPRLVQTDLAELKGPLHLEARIVPLGPNQALLCLRDRVELAQVKAALHSSQRRQEWVSGILPDLVLILDEKGVYREVLGNMELNLATRDELLNHCYKDLLPPEVARQYEEHLAEAKAQEREVTIERVVPLRKGLTNLEIRLQALPQGWVRILFRDLTDLSETREELKRQEQRLAEILAMLPDIVVFMDVKGYCWDIRGNLDLLLTPVSEVLGNHFSEILPPESSEPFALAFAECLAGEEVAREAKIELLKGLTHIEYLLRTNGSDGVILVVRDISQRKAAEQAMIEAKLSAERANLAKSNFLSAMSHELRTPMNGLLGMAQLLKDLAFDPMQQEYLEVMLSSGHEMMRVLGGILDLSRLESQQLLLDPKPVWLEEEMRSVFRLYKSSAATKLLDFRLSLPPKSQTQVMLDPGLLQKVLSNLLGNAIKFTDNGSVTLSLALLEEDQHRQRVRFEVADTGVGIAAEHVDLIFEAFSQTDNRITRKHGGTGVGLALAEKFVTGMGGRIQVESEPGRGSRFWFELNLQTVVESPFLMELPGPAQQPVKNDSRSQFDILIVEDDPINQMVIRRFLQRQGYQCELAKHGQAALDRLAQAPADLILMDCRMPVMDGYEASRRIRSSQSGKYIPIIALTAQAADETLQQCLEAGMDQVLFKPIDFEALQKTLDQCLSGSSPSQPMGN